MTTNAQTDVGYHARQHGRWHWSELAFWIVVLLVRPQGLFVRAGGAR